MRHLVDFVFMSKICLATIIAIFCKQKAAIRLQNIGLKAAATIKPHFAHRQINMREINYVCSLICLFKRE